MEVLPTERGTLLRDGSFSLHEGGLACRPQEPHSLPRGQVSACHARAVYVHVPPLFLCCRPPIPTWWHGEVVACTQYTVLSPPSRSFGIRRFRACSIRDDQTRCPTRYIVCGDLSSVTLLSWCEPPVTWGEVLIVEPPFICLPRII